MDADRFTELKDRIEALHGKLDKYTENTTKNTTDITWLKKGMFGTIFSYFGAMLYTKFGG